MKRVEHGAIGGQAERVLGSNLSARSEEKLLLKFILKLKSRSSIQIVSSSFVPRKSGLVIVLRSDTVSTKSLVLILEFFRGWTIVDNVSGWTQLIQSYPTVGLRLIGNNARYNAPTKCGRISLTGHFWHLRTDLRIRKSPEVEVSLNYIKTISQFELILANRTS